MIGLHWLHISRTWLISRTARRVYFCCAILTLVEIGLILGVQVALVAADAVQLVGSAKSVIQLLVLPAIAGTATLWVAMWYFWIGFDNSDWLKRALWFAGLALLAPFSTLLYFFFVYSRSPAFREDLTAAECQSRTAPAG